MAGLGLAWLGWAGLGWAGLGWVCRTVLWLGWAGLGWAGLGQGWAGLGWAGLFCGWTELGWAGLCDVVAWGCSVEPVPNESQKRDVFFIIFCSVVCNIEIYVLHNNEFLSLLVRDILGEDPTLSGLDSSMNDELEDVEDAWSQNEKEVGELEDVEDAWSQKEADQEDGSGQSAPMEATLLYQARMSRLFLDIMYILGHCRRELPV